MEEKKMVICAHIVSNKQHYSDYNKVWEVLPGDTSIVDNDLSVAFHDRCRININILKSKRSAKICAIVRKVYKGILTNIPLIYNSYIRELQQSTTSLIVNNRGMLHNGAVTC